jgi:tubulin monoglycylase TTLL3/8
MNNKKALYLNMKNYYEALDQDVFANLPLTFHVKNGLDDPEFQRFEQYYAKCEEEVKNKKAMQKQRRKDERDHREKAKDEDDISPHTSPTKKSKEANDEPQYYQSLAAPKNIWIIKPGENTNQGRGIQVAKDFAEIKDIIIDSTQNRKRTCIVQKYIHNPLLIHRRKFDIRTFALMTSVNGTLKAYLYEEGYLRTSCREYSINNLHNKLVHLTNDAVQKRSEDYGKFEPGNKLSYSEF